MTAESTVAAEEPARQAADTNPFRGLVPYEERDTLFARDADVDLIQSRIWSSRTTVLFAGSGVGKTSFLNAKLMPMLKGVFGATNVFMPQKWALNDPAAAIAAARDSVKGGESSRRGSVIVLDQFEEIFQHLSKPQILRDAGDRLGEIVQDERANVRLLLSIREEFLADLSLFDVFMPRVLTNYYRLGRLTLKHARLIIESTAKLGGRRADAERLGMLIEDLSAVHNSTQSGGLFVDPPYLQIVCRRIWAREADRSDGLFLASYSKGEACSQLGAYCEEKLEVFSFRQRRIVAKAIQQLTGPHEAKKPSRVGELAAQICESEGAVTTILDSLSGHDVRILRKWPDQEVFELYHDMYAPMLWKWKTAQERRERQRSFVTAVILAAAVLWLVVWPIFNWSRASVFLTAAEVSTVNQRDVSTVLDMRNAFARTVLLRPIGDWLWRSYMRRLETLSALLQDSDAAIGYRLGGLAAGGELPPHRVEATLGPGASLRGAVTRISGVSDAALDGDDVVIGTRDGKIIRWRYGLKTRETAIVVPEVEPADWGLPATTQQAGDPQKPWVLCLSADGRHAGVAWFTNGLQRIGVFSTQDGRKTASEDLTLDERGESLPDIHAVFSPDAKQLAVIHSKGATVLGPTFSWKVPLEPKETIVDAAFVSDDELAVATSSSSHPDRDNVLVIWRTGGKEQAHWETMPKQASLPPGAMVVTDGRGSLLARIDGQWQWITRKSRRQVTVPRANGMSPKAYAHDAGLLVSLDLFQQVVLSRPSNADPEQFHVVTLTASRPERPATRRLTSANLAHLPEQRLLSIDDDSTAVRVWDLHTEATTESRRTAESMPARVEGDKRTIGGSIDGKWSAWLLGGDICVGPRIVEPPERQRCERIWRAATDVSAKSAFVNVKGDRVVLATDRSLWYGGPEGGQLKRFSDVDGDVVFGPGSERVTVLSRANQVLLVARPGDSVSPEEWRAPVRSNTFLFHGPNEDAAIVYSRFWIHQLSTSPGVGLPIRRLFRSHAPQWPRVVSVLRSSPINSIQPDAAHRDRIFVNDDTESVDFSAEERRLVEGLPLWLSPARLAPVTIRWCGEESPSASSVRFRLSAVCDWEMRSGRRLGTPPPQ